MKTSKMIRRAGLGVLATVAAIQFVPVSRTNPPVKATVKAPEQVLRILRESCFDCHSNETIWPWYGYIAPVSWLIARDVEKGREHFNFSDFETYSADEQADLREEIWEEVEDGEMPLDNYLILHGNARLTDEQKEALKAWGGGGSGTGDHGKHNGADDHGDGADDHGDVEDAE